MLNVGRASMACGVMAAFTGPFIAVLANSHILSLAPEFVAYRVGNALMLFFGEDQYVTPVQGIPNAILSKALTSILFAQHDKALLTYPVLQDYGVMFYGVVISALAGLAIYAWLHPALSWHNRLAFSGFVLTPFYVGGPNLSLLLSPEYWLFELLWLAGSLLVLFRNRQNPWLVGAWAGLGISIKITLAPVGVLLLVAGGASKSRAFRFVAASAFVYIALPFLYAGWQGANILAEQALFFVVPNVSAMYDSLGETVIANPFGLSFFVLGFVLAIWRRHIPAMLIMAIGLYLVYARPHDTSLASAAMMMLFVAFALSGRLAPYLLSVLIVVGAATGFRQVYMARAVPMSLTVDEQFGEFFSDRPAMWLMASNRWNLGLMPQLFGYSGGLALRPTNDRGYVIEPKAYRHFFGALMIVGTSNSEINMAARLAEHGTVIQWTQPAESDLGVRLLSRFVQKGMIASVCSVRITTPQFGEKDWKLVKLHAAKRSPCPITRPPDG